MARAIPSETGDAAKPITSRDIGSPERAGYRRSAGSKRGEARRRELLNRITDDLVTNGLADFSLRRAARAAGTTHKVLLYYFDGADDVLLQAVLRQRGRRVEAASVAAGRGPGRQTLSARVRAIWPVLIGEESGLGLLDQAIGLAMYDPQRYAAFGREAQQEYLPTLLSICPDEWSDRRKLEVAEMILATLRGFLVDWRTSGERAGVDAGFEALTRALDREESAHE